MARGYGMKLSNEAAQKIVDGWRDRNRWARKFGDQCEDAAFAAISHAEEEQKAGRLSYVYIPQMMRGTLLCRLPDGRFIAYPMARVEDVEKFGRMNRTITYLNGMGRRSLWSGLQVENVTQATAASMLRQTLVHLEQNETEAQIIGHTHDEVICEIDEDQTEAFADRLKRVMVAGFDWTKGLPLGAEVKSDWYYHK